jgi:ABC-type multidrug transport system fused ATPase/permease subunit
LIKKILINYWNKFFLTKKKKLIFVILLLIVNSFSEILTVGSVLPVISYVFSNNENSIFINYLVELYSFFGLDIKNNIVFYIFFSFIFVTIFNLIIRIFITIYIQFYLKQISIKFTKQITQSFFLQNYSNLISRNSSDINHLFTEKTDNSSSFLVHLVIFISNLFLGFGIIIFLFFLDFKITLFLLIIFLAVYFFLISFFKNTMNNISKDFLEFRIHRYKISENIIGYLRQVLLTNLKEFYLNELNMVDQKIKTSNFYIIILGSLPKFFIEAIFIICFLLIVFFLIKNSSYDKVYFMTIIGGVIFSFQKLLMIFNQLHQSYLSISTLKHSTYETFQLTDAIEENSIQKLNFSKEIIFQNVSFRYSNTDGFIFHNINFCIKKNTILGIVGASGSGKSTLVDILCGLLIPNSGNIFVDGTILSKKNIASWREQFSYSSQNNYISETTIKENIVMSNNDYEIIDEAKLMLAIERSRCSDFITNNKNDLNTLIGKNGIRLSGGQIQRISIARVFYRNSDIFIFDESTNAIDEITENKILENLTKYYKNKTIILITHKKTSLAICRQILKVENKKIKLFNSYNDYLKNS